MYKKYYELKESLRKEIMDRIGVDKTGMMKRLPV